MPVRSSSPRPDSPSSPTGWPAARRRCRGTTTRWAATATTLTIRARTRATRPSTAGRRSVPAGGAAGSGIGPAANFWAGNVGSETSGSVLSPSNQNMLAGIKPTLGRISRYGVIPITADQDTPGPMARTVSDAAIMLGALEGAQPDPHDSATKRCAPPPGRDYTRFLDAN